MNRYELFSLIALIIGLTIFLIRSRWFDRFIDFLTVKEKDTSIEDLKLTRESLDKKTQSLKKDVDNRVKNAQSEQEELNKFSNSK